jgi:hypothetical protein
MQGLLQAAKLVAEPVRVVDDHFLGQQHYLLIGRIAEKLKVCMLCW